MAKRKIYFDETSKITKEGKKELKRLLKNLNKARHEIDKFLYNPHDVCGIDWTPGTTSDVCSLEKHFGVK